MNEIICQTILLESPEVAASQGELAMRAEQAGDSWPHPGFLQISPVEGAFAADQWRASPGSTDTHLAVARLMQTIQPILDSEAEASVCWPLCRHGHWTWLCFTRAAKPYSQAEPNKWVTVYRDSLSQPHVRCRDYAVIAMSLAVQLFSADRMESHNLPERQLDSVP